MARVLLALIFVYQKTLSRILYGLFGPICRFEPSCSKYAAACVQGHGALRGSLLSIRRVSRCHPFHPGGWDPPPPPRGASASHARGPTSQQLPPASPPASGAPTSVEARSKEPS